MNRLGIGLACVALMTTAACGGSDKPSKPKTFTASGSIKLYATGAMASGDGCTGKDGYDDITGGAPVLITDAKNTKVGLGHLEDGQTGAYSTCKFYFTVADIPSGKGPYSVEVSHRGATPFSEDEATSIALTLG